MKAAIATAVVLFGALDPAAGQADSAALPQISVTPIEGGVRLEASLLGLAPGEVTATFTIDREESGNLVRSSQSSTLPVLAGERHAVAETTLSMNPSATLTANLALRSGEKDLGDARLRIGTDRQAP